MSFKTAAELEKEYNELLIDSLSGLDQYPQDPAELAKIERAEIRMKAAQMRERIQRRLVPDELESLVREVQTDIIKARIVLPGETLLEKSERVMREMGLDIEYTGEHQSAEALETAYNKLVVESDKLGAPEERAVFEEAERGALKDIEVDRSFYRSPAVEARIAHDTELAMKGLRESTSKSSGFGFEPQKSTVKTYTDDMGVKINSDFRPPQYDLFMEGGAEIEMQTIPSKLGGPWMSPHNVETTPYKWLSPSEIQMQALADEADQHFESLVSDDEIDGKIDTIEAQQQAIAKKAVEARGARSGDPAMLPEARTELTRTRVQLPSGDYHELADGALTRVETDWLARYDRMRSQDARSLKVDADLRALEVRRRALLHREHAREVSQVQLDDEFLNDGVRLGSREIAQETMAEQLERLTPAQRESLAMELAAKGAGVEAMTTGEIMLRFGKGLGANAVAMGALTALGFALPKKASEGLNVVMDAAAVAALVTGVDPAFAVVQGTMELVKEMTTQAHRLKYNLDSDRDHGNNFGYVRDGAHWYPAYVKQHEEWEGGVGERGNDLDLTYGTHMTLTVLPNNKIEPHFQQQLGVRHVTGSDKDLLKTFKHITAEDPLRDWYLLQPDQLDMVRRAGQIIVLPKAGFVVHKDDWDLYKVPPSRSDGEPYLPTWWKANLDLRRSLDYIHHWQIGSKAGRT